MGEVISLPKEHLSWPKLTVHTVDDRFNEGRGRHFYLGVDGTVHGPFHSKLSASLDLMKTHPRSGVPMRTPFEQDEVWWWKKDTDEGVVIDGPYQFQFEAEQAISRHIQNMKDRAAHDEYR